MSRVADPKNRVLWRKRFKKFSKSGLSVDRFCEQERVSLSAFYNWRKKLSSAVSSATVTTPGRKSFRRVKLIESPAHVSIHLPCGTRIEVRAENLDAVRAVISEVASVGSVREGNGTSC